MSSLFASTVGNASLSIARRGSGVPARSWSVVLLSMGVDLGEALATVAASRPMAGPEAGRQRELLDLLVARST